MAKLKVRLCLFLILAIASFFRLWQLNEIPPGLYPDVAINGNEAWNSLKTGNFRVFYPENNGREGLFIWLTALSFSIFGVSIWAIKFVAAIIGILTVFGLYLLTKELFRDLENGSRYIALLSSFFLAISFWHTNFSRIGFWAILLPFILVLAFYFLFKALNQLKNQSKQNYITVYRSVVFGGIIFGLGFYTYSSFRMTVLILPFFFIPLWFFCKKQNLSKQFIFSTLYFLLSVFIVALPIGLYFIQNPEHFISRMAPISVFAAENPIKEFGKSLILHLAMFNFYGDPNWRHNFSGSPQLLFPIGILFLIGLFLSFKEIFKKSNYQNQNYQRLLTFYFLLSTFFIMLFPGILAYEGIPHSLRTIGVIPPVYIFVGFGAFKTYQWLNQNTKNKKLLILTSLFFLFTIGFFQFNKYFVKWAKTPEVKNAFSADYVEIGNYLNSLPPGVQKYVIVNEPGVPLYGISIPAQTPMFIEATKYGKPQSIYLKVEDLDQIKINQRKTVIIPLYNGRLFDELQKRFPQGKIEAKDNFQIYKIKNER